MQSSGGQTWRDREDCKISTTFPAQWRIRRSRHELYFATEELYLDDSNMLGRNVNYKYEYKYKVVKALRYKTEGRGFDNRLGDFF
jgi:hypothetical protein